VKTYLIYVKLFLLANKDKEIREFSKKDVREFLYKMEQRDVSGSTLNVAHNALRFMMIQVLHKACYLKIRYAKTPIRKPEYLTKEEVNRILSAIENQEHRLIVSLMYGAGLRVREVTRLKTTDFSFEEDIGWVRGGKGNKDRPFIIPQSIKQKLHPHMFRHSFATHLLESGIDVTSVQSLLGHVRPETTLGYSHALRPKMIAIKSPLD
jgi:site-specific recombinase XerD